MAQEFPKNQKIANICIQKNIKNSQWPKIRKNSKHLQTNVKIQKIRKNSQWPQNLQKFKTIANICKNLKKSQKFTMAPKITKNQTIRKTT